MAESLESGHARHFHRRIEGTTGSRLHYPGVRERCGGGSMTGRYLICTPVESARDEKRFDTAWRKFVAVCRSLHQDGLTYDVRFNLAGANPHVLVTASGTAKPRKLRAAHRLTLPPPVPVQRCKDRALEVTWFLPENRERRNSATSYWGKHQERYRELSGMAEDYLRAELEHWRELEALNRQREHFKPGRADETATADDEVAA